MSETANISEVANRVAKDIFEVFKWEKIPIMDENFKCHKIDEHRPKSRKKHPTSPSKYTHPVDVVFKYYDPYLNKYILLNTDLKSYKKGSIKFGSTEDAIKSLSHTIDCARSSTEWIKKYSLDDSPFEVRGMLFIYNHDNEYDKSFFSILKRIKPDRINLKKNLIIHVLEPIRIRYLNTVIADLRNLQVRRQFPMTKYSFFYPDLHLHKTHGDAEQYPATIEILCSPYMILKHGPFKSINEDTGENEEKSPNGGYLIYYNQNGGTEHEFMYLFDSLSRFQILNSDATIKIRVAHHEPAPEIKSNYERAIKFYVRSWHLDKIKLRQLERIEFDITTQTVPNYNPGILAWRLPSND
jgi:hypothetical protein